MVLRHRRAAIFDIVSWCGGTSPQRKHGRTPLLALRANKTKKAGIIQKTSPRRESFGDFKDAGGA
jgi:hypothetical protein